MFFADKGLGRTVDAVGAGGIQTFPKTQFSMATDLVLTRMKQLPQVWHKF